MNPNANIADILAKVGFEETAGSDTTDEQRWILPGENITADRSGIWVTIRTPSPMRFSVNASGAEGIIRQAISEL